MKKIVIAAVIAAMLTACAAPDSSVSVSGTAAVQTSEVVFTDSAGRTVTVSAPERTAVFTGSYADIWQLAGGTVYAATEDAFDDRLYTLPDDVVNIGSLSAPSLETIIDENIDFVILSSTSSKMEGDSGFAELLEEAGITCALFEVEDFDGYLSMLKICTEITGRDDLYQKNGEDIRAEVEKYIEAAQGRETKTVLYLRAYSTGIKAKGSDSMTGKMLADMNCVNIADLTPSLLEDLSIEEIIVQDPDYIFITTMGSDEEKAKSSFETILASNPAWDGLSAVKNGRCVFLPKQYFHYKPNAEWDEAYKMLWEILKDD